MIFVYYLLSVYVNNSVVNIERHVQQFVYHILLLFLLVSIHYGLTFYMELVRPPYY